MDLGFLWKNHSRSQWHDFTALLKLCIVLYIIHVYIYMYMLIKIALKLTSE